MRGELRIFVVALALWVVPALGTAGEVVPTCCNCQDCPKGVSACIELPPGTSDTAQFIAEVCQPLGCTGGAGCIDAECANFRLCTEENQCGDGFDNDADGLTDCADSVCAGEIVCGGGVPVLSWAGVGVLITSLVGFGVLRLKRR